MGYSVRPVPGTAHDDAKSSCARGWSTVRRSVAAPHLGTVTAAAPQPSQAALKVIIMKNPHATSDGKADTTPTPSATVNKKQCQRLHYENIILAYATLLVFSQAAEIAGCPGHFSDVIMGAIASQITSLTIVYSTVYSGADQRKHQNSASLACVWGVHR